jgi:hypothetical protein
MRTSAVRHLVVGLRGQTQLGPYPTDEAFRDPVAHRVTLTHPDRGVAELAQTAQTFVWPAVGDALAVDVQRPLPRAVLVSLPWAVPAGLEEEAGLAERLDRPDRTYYETAIFVVEGPWEYSSATCSSTPTEVRRAEQDDLRARYRSALDAQRVSLDERTALEQYRLFSIYSWIAAVSTAAVGSQGQPIEIAWAAMLLTTTTIEDLRVVEFFEKRL